MQSIKAAATYYSHLLDQGVKPSVAMMHATLRFGIPSDEIRAEVIRRHDFSLMLLDVPLPEQRV